jgi:Holliday junction resolvasome RuvABC ATP-dependent DNA helicase subunit
MVGDAGQWPSVSQLPPAVADFTGRVPQIAQLTEMLSSDRGSRLGVPIAVISGLPGVGKTALALQVAHTMRSAFPDGQL